MKRTLGGALLVVGTTVGAGMLSLPLVTAACGFGVAVVLLILSWSVMCFTGFKLLHICSKYKEGVNFSTLLSKKMPQWVQVLFTIMYLLLLYALMAAYTTQGASLVSTVSQGDMHFVPIDALIFILIFGLIITGFTLSDYVNRSFLSVKFLFFILSVLTMLAFFNYKYIVALPLSFSAIIFAWPTLLPSFGFQNIIPVLYEYQKGDIKAIKRSILFGSVLVLVVYFLWIFACFSIMPQQGVNSYETIFHQGNTLSIFMNNIGGETGNHWIKTFLNVFINVSIITSFICSGLSLLHYLKDTFKRFEISISNTTGLVLSFLPPYLFTLFYPRGFILALQYASIFAVFIFVYMPILLDTEKWYAKKNGYPLVLGSLVIIAQILNLLGVTLPFNA